LGTLEAETSIDRGLNTTTICYFLCNQEVFALAGSVLQLHGGDKLGDRLAFLVGALGSAADSPICF
jgi:hydrogenase maturation factor HypE